MSEYFCVTPEQAGVELDELLCLLYPDCNKGFVRRQVRAGKVLVDGQTAVPSLHLRVDQVLIVDFDEDERSRQVRVLPTVQVPVLYEDERVMVVDKPPHLAAEPERWAKGNASLAGAVLGIALERSSAARERGDSSQARELSFRPRLVHRIDKETSGIVVVAKQLETERILRAAFDRGRVVKHYLALVEGEYPLGEGEWEEIDLPIDSDARRTGRMRVVDKGGKASRTRVAVAQRFRGYSLLLCQPKTGRTHQIRVHLAARGFPLAVDRVYGRRDSMLLSSIKSNYRSKSGKMERPLIDRLTLHAHRIEFPLPASPSLLPRSSGEVNGGTGEGPDRAQSALDGNAEEYLCVESPVPNDLARVLKQLAKVRPLER